MQVHNNDIEISRNETFSIDKIIKHKDGSPYIVSSALHNPYFLVSVSSTRYEQHERKVYNKWLDLKDFPKFSETVPVDLKSLTTEPNGNVSRYNSFNDITELIDIDTKTDILAYGYVGSYLFYYKFDDAVFYIEDENGERTYKYWSVDGWKEYTCRIVTAYTTDITSKWVEQNYVYSIDLVSGTSVREYLVSLCEHYEIEFTDENSNLDLYNELINKGVTLVEGFDINRAIIIFDLVKPILKPKRLTVSSNIQGGL